MKKPKAYIDTIRGKAYFVKTEKENKQGRWNDSYETVAGYFVIHEGTLHHVYKVGGNLGLNSTINMLSRNNPKIEEAYNRFLRRK